MSQILWSFQLVGSSLWQAGAEFTSGDRYRFGSGLDCEVQRTIAPGLAWRVSLEHRRLVREVGENRQLVSDH